MCLAIGRDGDAARTLFVGDTLFAGSIGRTDLPGGDLATLLNSIRKVLFAFPDDTVVYSGHGERDDDRHREADEPVSDRRAVTSSFLSVFFCVVLWPVFFRAAA